MSISLQYLVPLWGISGAREKFEEMCVQLIKNEHPTAEAIRVVQGDGGIDAHFKDGIDDSQKDQIVDSWAKNRLPRCNSRDGRK